MPGIGLSKKNILIMRNKNLKTLPRKSLSITGKTYLAYKKDFQNGVVTVGNVCNADCFFCSQKWNPPGVLQDLRRFLTLEEIKYFSNLYLKEVNGVGSGIHNNSGEFFLHPHALEILNLLAAANKIRNPIPLFTNGTELNEEIIKTCKKLGLYLSVSLNSTNPEVRTDMMGGCYERNKKAIDSIAKLDKYDVNYCVWIVPLRSNLENGDLEQTIRDLRESKADNIFIHLPGYTKYTPSQMLKELIISQKELRQFVSDMRQKYKIKIFLEIPAIEECFINILLKLSRLFKKKKYLNKKKKLFLCAQSVENVFPLVLQKMQIQKYEIRSVKSTVFGGSVECAGLLLVEDYIKAIADFLEKEGHERPDYVFLPRNSFDVNKEDLSMNSVMSIKDKYNVKLVVC